jgi:hypothetical protein
MNSNLTVNACIGIRDGCGMKYLINADGQVEFSFGSTRYPFEVTFDPPALRHFVELAGNALTQVAVSIVSGENDDPDQTEWQERS